MICLVSLLGQFGLMIYADHKAEIQANIAMATLILNLVSDCSTLCEAYIGLAVNGTLRKALFSMLFKRASVSHQEIP
ncbi:unnamed protein product, partial [Mesorhabditis belari]|uniref:Uncharacterized protein n=1 Tax=Mesorhabditis belari TaxID=2138241 RepID=A0AAF3EQE2_9BILA